MDDSVTRASTEEAFGKVRTFKLRLISGMAALAVLMGLAAAFPVSALAVYVPSIGDSLVYSATYAGGSESFPEAMAIGPSNSVFYTQSDYNRPPELPEDSSNYVVGLSSAGSEIFRKGAADYSVFYWPCALAFTPGGELVVADSENNRIVKYNVNTGAKTLQFGSAGTAALQFSSPAGVTVASDGTIWVSDTYNNRVQHFTAAGLYLGQFATGANSYPDGLAVDSNGDVWVCLSGTDTVKKYSPTGTVITTINTWNEVDAFGNPTTSDTFWGPRDVTIDPWGTIYIADAENSRIVRFQPNGQWLGSYNPAATMSKVSDIDVDALGNVYAADYVNDAIYKFNFVPAASDDVAPVTTSNIPTNWIKTPLAVTLTANDASSAVEATYYSIDGSDPTTLYTGPFTVSTEGTTTVKYLSEDVAGNTESVKTELLRIDAHAPISVLTAQAVTWGNDATVTISAADAMSGLKRIVYIVDNGFPQYYSAPFKVSRNGTSGHRVDYYSEDNAGNKELLRTFDLTINAPDTAPPNTTSNISEGWVNLDQLVELTAEDPISGDPMNGVAATYVSTDGSFPTTPYTAPIPVTTEGVTTFRYYSVDRRGNVEPLRTSYVKLDKSVPHATSDAQSTYVNNATINLTATDAVSGVLNIAYSLDSGPWVYASTVNVSTWGGHTLSWRATDNAGNVEDAHNASFTVWQPDEVAPITGDNISGSWTQGPYLVQLTAFDAKINDVSQVEGIYYSTDGSFPTIYSPGSSCSFPFNTEGSHIIKFFAVDTWGNAEAVQSRSIQIDNTKPVSSSNAASHYVGQANITLTASDALSQLDAVWYRLDGGAWIEGASGVVVSTTAVGNHTLEFYATDAAHNTESTHVVNFSLTPPDTVPPVTTYVGPTDWVKGPVTALLQAVDTSSAISGTWYSLDGTTPSILYSGSVSVANEGQNTLKYRSADTWSNLEDVKTTVVKIDNSAPVTGHNASASYVDQAVITLSPNDPYSGTATTKYRVDGGTWKTGTEVTVTGYWTHTVQFYSVDNVGNTEGTKSVSFSIRRQDRTYYSNDSRLLYKGTWAPGYSGSVMKSSTPGSAVWFYAQASRIRYVAAKAADAGIMRISIDGGAWTYVDLYSYYTNTWQYVFDSGDLDFDYHLVKVEYTGTKNAASSGTAINLDGVIVEGNLFDVPDSEAPVTTSDITSAWQHGPTSVTLAATDATTGVAATYYSTNGSAPTTLYTGPVSVSAEGTTQFKYYSVDKRGNAEAVKTEAINIDDSNPITTAPSNMPTSFTATSTVVLTPADPFSGVAYTRWRIDGGAWNTGTSMSIPGSQVGSHTLEWYSVDNIGHTETVKSATIAVLKRYEQSAAALAFRGSWTTASGGTLSGGTYKYGYSANAAMFATFSGTRVDWVTSKNASYGKARVILDGGTPVEVDLYNNVLAAQQRVWTSGTIAAGQHTLVIEYTGTKNASSSGYTVGVDAIDVIGELATDPAAPVTTANADDTWRNTPQTVTLTATDANSWVANTYYRINGGAQTTYSAPFSVSGEGVSTIEFWSVDGAGITETPKTATVRIDRGLPTVSSDAPTGWSAGTVTVALTGTDTQSGVDQLVYSTDGSAPATTYSGPISVTAEGSTNLRFRAIDKAGNTGDIFSSLVRIDHTAPATTDNVGGWSATPVTVTLTGTDSMSGIGHTYYRVDAGQTATYAGPFVVSGNGTHAIEYWSVDAVGNAEAAKTANVRIDTLAPQSSDNATGSWVISPAHITLDSADSGSGVAGLTYAVDGGVSTNYVSGVTVPGTGVHTISYRATDNVGNVEASRTATVYVDGTAPTVSADAPSGWYNHQVLCSLNATDAHSGVQLVSASVDGAAAVPYTGPLTFLTEGIHTVTYDAIDNVGNAADPQSATVTIDLTAPTTTSNAASLYTNTANIALSPSDTLSGVASTEYRLDGGAWVSGTSATTSGGGAHTLEFRSTDAAGNVEEIRSVSFSVKARSEQTANGVYYKGTWTTSNSAARSGGSWAYTNTSGSYALFHFNGTGFDLIGSTAPTYGKARIVVDGTAVGYADFYTSGYIHNYRVYSLSGLTAGTHAVRIEWSGTKNAASTGTGVGVDALDLIGVMNPDTGAPVAAASADTEWRNTPATVTLAADDAETWITAIDYRIDGGATTPYSTPFNVAGEGAHAIEYWAVDTAGNTSAPQMLTVRNDTTAPSTHANAPTDWVADTANVTLSSTDAAAGVATTLYSTDGSDPTTPYTGAISISTEGVHTVKFRSADAAGNTEDVQSVTVKVDTASPTASVTAPSGWVNSAQNLPVEAHDSASGIAHVFYGSGETPSTETTGSIPVVGEGVHDVTYRVQDAVGHFSTTESATVRIDLTAPITTSNALTSYTTSANVAFTASDALSGVAATEYRVNGGAWTQGTSFSTTAGGLYTLEFRSIDAAGNVEETRSATFSVRARVEETASGMYYKGTWNSSASASRSGGAWLYTNTAGSYALFHFSGTTFDLIGSTAPTYGKAKVVVDGVTLGYADFYTSGYIHNRKVFTASGLSAGPHTATIEWTGTKNTAATGTGIGVDALDITGGLNPDTAAPTTSVTADTSWRKTPATVTLAATDADTWVSSTKYRVDGGATMTYSAPFTVAGDGAHTVEYWSLDAANNAEAAQSLTVRTDSTSPSTHATAPAEWVAGTASVTLSASDAGSGVAQTLYSTDGSDPSVPYAGPIDFATEGQHVVKFRSTDAAGNTESVQSVTVKVDTEAPTASVNAPAGWVNAPQTLTIESQDSASGIARVYYGTGAEEPTIETTSGITISGEGTHAFTFRAQDGVGHYSATGSGAVQIDLTAPVTTSNAAAAYTGTANITFSASDALSGVATTEYRLDGGSWTPGASFTTAAGGTHTLDFRSVDAAGNVEQMHTVTFVIKARYEDNNEHIAYEGSWSKAANSKRSGGSWAYVNAAGSRAILNFTGTSVDLIGSTAPTYGKARLVLDGADIGYADFYTAGYLHNVKVWGTTGLADAAHTLMIEWSGTKNAASTGTGIGIDALDMKAALTTTVLRYEETDARMTWYGAWGASANTKRSGGAWNFVNAADGSVNVSFNGTAIDLIGSTAPNYGKAKVTIDGTQVQYADFYTSGYLHNRKVLGVTGLTNGPHTMTVEWTGTKSAASTGTGIGLDAVDITGGIRQALPAGPALTRFEQNNSKIVYDGTWVTSSSTARSGGSWAYTNTAGSAAYIAFTGTRIDLIGSTAPTYGKAKVTIDGTHEYTADFYTSGYLHNRKVLGVTGLTSGTHTVAIEWTGTKNAAATGTGIGLDAVDVDGALNQAVLPGYPVVAYEETEPAIQWTGSWVSSASSSRSGGAWAYSNTPTSTASFSFTGTRLEYYVSKAPTYGIARLTIDGVAHDVDLYSSGYVHNVLAWSSGKIADGVHAVTIEWTGTKNASATGTGIGVDVLKIQGLIQ